MADLCIFRRVEAGHVAEKLARTSDVDRLAMALADGQAFDVEVFAVYPRCGHLMEQLQEVLHGHIKNGWYATDSAISVAVAVAMQTLRVPSQQEQFERPEDNEMTSVDGSDAESTRQQLTLGVLEHLDMCDNAFADKATVVRKGLIAKLGKEKARSILNSLKESVLKGGAGDGKQRLLLYQGRAVKLKADQ